MKSFISNWMLLTGLDLIEPNYKNDEFRIKNKVNNRSAYDG